MEVIIRNRGIMAAKLKQMDAVILLEKLKPNLVEKNKPVSKCAAIYKISNDLKMPIPTPSNEIIDIFLWKEDTTLEVYLK